MTLSIIIIQAKERQTAMASASCLARGVDHCLSSSFRNRAVAEKFRNCRFEHRGGDKLKLGFTLAIADPIAALLTLTDHFDC
jgi:hypothetical protein